MTKNPLENYPKYLHGELRNNLRTTEKIQRLQAKLAELEAKQFDTSGWDAKPRDWLYDRWIQNQDGLHLSGNTFTAEVWQSVWPEETDGMIFQDLWTHLGVRFKWWGAGKFDGSYIVTLHKDADMKNGALPNVNACKFACEGDYSSPLKDNTLSKIAKLREFQNYISSPNLREGKEVTSLYCQVATKFQQKDVLVKIAGEEQTVNFSDLIVQLAQKTDGEMWRKIQDNQCYYCKANRTDWINPFNRWPSDRAQGNDNVKIGRQFMCKFTDVEAVQELEDPAFSLATYIKYSGNETDISDKCRGCIYSGRTAEGVARISRFWELWHQKYNEWIGAV